MKSNSIMCLAAMASLTPVITQAEVNRYLEYADLGLLVANESKMSGQHPVRMDMALKSANWNGLYLLPNYQYEATSLEQIDYSFSKFTLLMGYQYSGERWSFGLNAGPVRGTEDYGFSHYQSLGVTGNLYTGYQLSSDWRGEFSIEPLGWRDGLTTYTNFDVIHMLSRHIDVRGTFSIHMRDLEFDDKQLLVGVAGRYRF